MTDKQIIDGIDISKCDFCEDSEYCHIYSGTADFRWMCKENEDCQIKNLLLQLKRKEQECEELKYANDCILTTLNVIAEGNKQLRQTLTEIKEIANQILDDDDNHCPFELSKQILQKISECEGNNG